MLIAAVVVTRAVIAGRPAPGTPAAVFDRQWSASGGDVWSFRGRAVASDVIDSSAGPPHCGWESATFLSIGWPAGTTRPPTTVAHEYVRDPERVLTSPPNSSLATLERNATLPPDATSTGLRHAGVEVYVSRRTGEGAIYVVGGGVTERWPRADPPIMCA